MVASNSQILGQAPAQHQTQAQVMAMAMATSPPKTMPTSPKQKMITQGHQRMQSLLDLAATWRSHWPALPSPLPKPLTSPPPLTEKGQGGGVINVDYFGATTPTDESTNLPPPLPGKPSLMPSLGNTMAPWVDSSTRGLSPAPSIFDAFAQPCSRSPMLTLSTPPTGQSTQRVALSPPPCLTAIMNNPSLRPPSSSPIPVLLLPPPSDYRLAVLAKPSPAAPLAEPESTLLVLLMGNNEGTNIGLPAAKATPPPPIKGAGGLSTQDLSFFEGLSGHDNRGHNGGGRVSAALTLRPGLSHAGFSCTTPPLTLVRLHCT